MIDIYNPNVANSLVALRDLAEAGARVLDEREAHYFAQYPLCSTAPRFQLPPTFEDSVGKLLKLLYTGNSESGVYSGDHVDSDLRWPASKGDLRPDITRDEAEWLVLFYNRRGLKGNPSVSRWLIGRELTTVDEWVKLQLGG
ncbi:hypothetical protein N7516_003430 [Penicillium verrucosum]|uniref:uncharacterized protein n=1 Tax=Penicillium verrucosum TaxID=60171 RepID=UPI002545A0CB|nr:uncharacterized protein N7516_003430 [Penicillium verrucosum]KAJ5943262.1 hypothetical protein N7516_003430 [Penicillium verrucosum]